MSDLQFTRRHFFFGALLAGAGHPAVARATPVARGGGKPDATPEHFGAVRRAARAQKNRQTDSGAVRPLKRL